MLSLFYLELKPDYMTHRKLPKKLIGIYGNEVLPSAI